MTQTVFNVDGQECKGANPLLPVLILAVLGVSIVVVLNSDGHYRFTGVSPVLLLAGYLSRRKLKEDARIFVNQRGSDFEFGYYNKANKMQGPFPVLEYTYWCFERSAAMNGWNYELYLQINTKKSAESQDVISIYFKQEIVARNPPAGWERTKQQIKEGPGVFIVPDLPKLAALIDAVPSAETLIGEQRTSV